MIRFFLLTFVLISCSQQPGPVPQPNLDANPSRIVDACANMARLGCAEGSSQNCAETIAKIINTQITPLNVDCLIFAQSKADLAKCPVSCR